MPLSHYADELQRDFNYFLKNEESRLEKSLPSMEFSSYDYTVFSLLNTDVVDEDGFRFIFHSTNRETGDRGRHLVDVTQFTVGNRTWKFVDYGISSDYWSNEAILVMEVTEGDKEPFLVGFSKSNNSWDYSPDELESFPPAFFRGGWHKVDIHAHEDIDENLARAKKELEFLKRTVHLLENGGLA